MLEFPEVYNNFTLKGVCKINLIDVTCTIMTGTNSTVYLDLSPLGTISNETIYNVAMELGVVNPAAFTGLVSVKTVSQLHASDYFVADMNTNFGYLPYVQY